MPARRSGRPARCAEEEMLLDPMLALALVSSFEYIRGLKHPPSPSLFPHRTLSRGPTFCSPGCFDMEKKEGEVGAGKESVKGGIETELVI